MFRLVGGADGPGEVGGADGPGEVGGADGPGEVAAEPLAGAAEVLGAGVPLAMIEQGPAAVGGAFWTPAHPASTNTTPASGAVTFLRDGIRIIRR